jgi:hypothetical protein
MVLEVKDSDSVVVTQVHENTAASCASDFLGNTKPIKVNDKILEINGVSLKVLKLDLIKFY